MKIAEILTHILPNWSPFPHEVRLIDGIPWTIYRVSTNWVEYRSVIDNWFTEWNMKECKSECDTFEEAIEFLHGITTEPATFIWNDRDRTWCWAPTKTELRPKWKKGEEKTA